MDTQKTHGAFSWMELQGRSTANGREFYAQLFGWNQISMPMQDGSTYDAFALGESPLGGFAAKQGLDQQWLPYVTVDDVDATALKAVKAGGNVRTEPFDAPGVGRIAVIEDPNGAPTAVIKYPSA